MEESVFEMDEEKALKDAFTYARKEGKIFNINKWKMKREQERLKRGIKL